ncbi:unnamed protein product [Moneuplotes crassus]|uniref:Uncharacterized protein n=1 Tax=Euplotes crassus TaxID=5936 RepID=A0AAD1XNE8_EUPCR|nr:unnamed protein product [Moneuplotes crassus]
MKKRNMREKIEHERLLFLTGRGSSAPQGFKGKSYNPTGRTTYNRGQRPLKIFPEIPLNNENQNFNPNIYQKKMLEVKPKEKDILPVKPNKRDAKFAGKVQDNTAKDSGFAPLDSSSNLSQSKGTSLAQSSTFRGQMQVQAQDSESDIRIEPNKNVQGNWLVGWSKQGSQADKPSQRVKKVDNSIFKKVSSESPSIFDSFKQRMKQRSTPGASDRNENSDDEDSQNLQDQSDTDRLKQTAKSEESGSWFHIWKKKQQQANNLSHSVRTQDNKQELNKAEVQQSDLVKQHEQNINTSDSKPNKRHAAEISIDDSSIHKSQKVCERQGIDEGIMQQNSRKSLEIQRSSPGLSKSLKKDSEQIKESFLDQTSLKKFRGKGKLFTKQMETLEENRSSTSKVHDSVMREESSPNMMKVIQNTEKQRDMDHDNQDSPQAESVEPQSSFQKFMERKKLAAQRELANLKDSDSEEKANKGQTKRFVASSKYKGKSTRNSRMHGYTKKRPTQKPYKKKFGYGEISRPDSPSWRETSFHNSRRPNQGLAEADVEVIELSSEMHRQEADSINQNAPNLEPEDNPAKSSPSQDEKCDDQYENIRLKDSLQKYKPSITDCVEVAKRCIVASVEAVEKKFTPEFLEKLNSESLGYKSDVLVGKLDLALEQKFFGSGLGEELANEMSNRGICLCDIDGEGITRWESSNVEAIEHFLKGFNSIELYPTLNQLKLILEFHSNVTTISLESVREFLFNRKSKMIERQYFAKWISSIFGLNLSSLKMASIEVPENIEDYGELLIKLMGLLCLFYDLKPQELMKLQMCSIVYLKPHFCFKSEREDYVMILPICYSKFLHNLISKSHTCDRKSCSQIVDQDHLRNFCYHDQNRLFSSLEPNMREFLEEINQGQEYSLIYADTTKFIRVLDFSRKEKESIYPAHVVTKKQKDIPLRILDSRLDIIHSKTSSEASKVFRDSFKPFLATPDASLNLYSIYMSKFSCDSSISI